ncbi:THO complex subunit 2-like isoform X2 [Halichondria panicea]|uniref:THO complex subunit 2-like isoform X2 n=1 Tax=Halichondria panicea TaxID=6063 RepID=UPI00312B454F
MMALSEELVKDWSTKGHDKALALFEDVLSTGTHGTDCVELRGMLYDLLKHCVTGALDGQDVATFISELTSIYDLDTDLPSVLSDLLAVLDAETISNENKDERTAFVSVTTALMKTVGEPLLKERLEMETLEQVSLVPSARNFNQKYVKTKTKLFYKQQKFNLFREENEGYSKLVVELGHEERPLAAAPAMLDNIRSLIGRFNLDPNRVLDVILEAFECHLDQHEFFLSLLHDYPCEKNTFVNVLGFKFHQFQSADGSTDSPTPSSLYKLSALLLHRGLVTLEDLYPHLSQSDSTLKELHQSSLDDALTRAKRANIVSFAEKSEETLQKEADAEQEKKVQRERLLSIEFNQKLGLCHALIEFGDWEGACSLMKLLPQFLAVWSPPVARSLCSLISHVLEPLYRNYASRAVKGKPRSSTTLPIPTCSKMEDLYPLTIDMLCHLGPALHSDPILIAKLLRLGRLFFKERASIKASGELPSQEKELVYQGLLTILDEVLLPSLCLLPSNCGMAEEAWAMVKQLPYQTRYQLYGRWKNDSFQHHPELIDAKTETLNRGKFIMKRITVDNIKPSGRQIGKLSHSFPGVIFDYVLSQIQRYDNFISPVVDSLKYLTPLGYDVLAYCIIEALGSPQKERMKYNDTNISQWLKGLSSFCSNIFKKYSIELTGLLQYVANQLKAGKSVDLLVLKEVIVKMAGIDVTETVTSQQLEALSGGELLKAEGAYYGQVRNTKKSCQRLREALVDAKLSHPLLLLMAQQRDCIVHVDGESRHLKLVGMLYDNCLDTLVQFGEFLSIHTSPDEYKGRLPSLTELRLDYHLPVDVAFYMLRPVLHTAITDKFFALEEAAGSEKLDKKAKASRQEANFRSACCEVLDPVVEAVRGLHPAKVWEDVSCRLYTTFWVLSTYDLYVPTGRYDEEIGRAKQAIKDLDSSSDMTSSKKKKEQDRNSVLIEKLQEEKQRQEDNHRLVMSWIKHEKANWFNSKVAKNRTITQFLQLCVFPRCRFTTLDALYCARFVIALHSQQTPNFSTLLFFDRMFSDISYTVSCCTENEAMRYGRFLGALLETVSRWHLEDSVYSLECAKTPGFISMMRSSGQGNEKQDLDYENFRHITFKWHFKLTKSFAILLESKDYLQLRNALFVLIKIVPYYPKVFHLSIALEKRLEKILEEEKDKRQDLYTLALGCAGKLKAHKPNLIPEAEFHIREERVKAQQSDHKDDGLRGASSKSASKKVAPTSSKITSTKATPATTSRGSSKATPTSSSKTKDVKEKGNEESAVKVTEDSDPSAGGKNSGKSSRSSSGERTQSTVERSQSPSETKAKEKGGNGSKSSSSLSTTVRKSRTSIEGSSNGGVVKVRKSSPATPTGPAAAVSPRTGTRRHQIDSPDPSLEKDVKRRKIDDSSSKSSLSERTAREPTEAAAPNGDQKSDKRRSDRKRLVELTVEKDVSETKRRKDSPASHASSDSDVKEKKRLKVVQKETKSSISPITTKKIPSEDKTKKPPSIKIRSVRK